MHFKLLLLLAVMTTALASFAQEEDDSSVAPGSKNLLSRKNMDTTVSPGDNFYRYANGNWLKTHRVGHSGTARSSITELRSKNEKKLHAILDSVAAITNAAPGSNLQKLGDFYRAGMDSAAIEKAGLNPLKSELTRIDSITDEEGLLHEIALEHTEGLNPLFGFSIYPDEKNAAKETCHFWPGGLGMPRGFYFDDDSRAVNIREVYKIYIKQILLLIGDSKAKDDAWYIYDLEFSLMQAASNWITDPVLLYNKYAVARINKLTPGIDWETLLAALEVPGQDSVIIQTPEFFTKIAKQLNETRLKTWKKYLQFHLVDHMAPYLSSAFDSAWFNFHHRVLQGQKEQGARWKRIIAAIDWSEGGLLGQMYVARYVRPETKERMAQLVDNLQQAYAARIRKIDWMSDSTKQKALVKLNAILKKIAYPDQWKNYNTLTIVLNDYMKNIMVASAWAYHQNLSKLGKPVNKAEWSALPQTVNAFYNPLFNEIVFPAGILQSPFFDEGSDDAVIYGGLGAIIGHEMTHGFDNEGRKYDANGNLDDWWAPQDAANFTQKAQQVVDEYNKVAVMDNYHIDGRFTEPENLADLGGLNIAYEAFKKTKQWQGNDKIDGFTPDQRFFLSWAHSWRANILPEELLVLMKTDAHAHGEPRVNIPVSNMDAWYKAFNIQPTDRMYRPPDLRARVW